MDKIKIVYIGIFRQKPFYGVTVRVHKVAPDVNLINTVFNRIYYIFFARARAAVQYKRCTRSLFYLFQTFNIEFRHLSVGVIPVRCSYRYCQSVYAGFIEEYLRLIRVGIHLVLRKFSALGRAEPSDFALNAHSAFMRIIGNLSCHSDVFFQSET